MLRSVTYGLRPGTRAKWCKLHEVLQGCNKVWNLSLAETIEAYDARRVGEETALMFEPKQSTSFFSLSPRNRKYREEQEWLARLPSAITRYMLNRQADAWRRLFEARRKGDMDWGPPRFKSRYHDGSFTIPQNVRIRNRRLWVPKVGWCYLSGSMPYPDGVPRQATVQYAFGRWLVTVQYEVPDVAPADNGLAVSIDLNHAPNAIAISTRDTIPLPCMKRKEARKKRYQRRIARQCKGSNRRRRTLTKFRKACRSISNTRKDWQHHETKRIAATAGQVCYEDLEVKKMSQSKSTYLNRENLAVGWAGIRQKLEYKCAMPTPVEPAYTSRTCSNCNHVNSNRNRVRFECGECGHTDKVHYNATDNILARGTRATGRLGALALATPMTRQRSMQVEHYLGI